VAILVDATLVRVVMLPSILALLGDKAWWPLRIIRPLPEPVVVEEPGVPVAVR
jgi:RND superfamily putative drug exporter